MELGNGWGRGEGDDRLPGKLASELHSCVLVALMGAGGEIQTAMREMGA